MSTYGPFSAYAIALELASNEKAADGKLPNAWQPVIYCGTWTESDWKKPTNPEEDRHGVENRIPTNQRSGDSYGDQTGKYFDPHGSNEDDTASLEETAGQNGHEDGNPKRTEKPYRTSPLDNLEIESWRSNTVKPLDDKPIEGNGLPPVKEVHGKSALDATRITYKTTTPPPHDHHDVLYRVYRKPNSWEIREFSLGYSDAPVLVSNVHFFDDQAGNSFELDFALLNRLYLLASITAGRRQIHERLAHILTSRESVHHPHAATKRGRIRTAMQRATSWLSAHLPQVVATSTVLSCGFAIALIWLKVWDCPDVVFTIALYLFGLTSLTGVAAFVQALRQKQGQTPEDKQIEKISEMAIELRSELAQINLKVASGYACIDNTPLEATSALSPEGLLREIDEALHIKASFDSLDKVIATQSQNVSSDHKQKQEHRLHAYQNIVAAGSGVFTGFFTYEVGESVLKFIHASQFADDRSLQYWLFTKAGVSASLQGAGQSPAHAPVLPVVGEAHAEPGAEQTSVTTAQSINELDQLYHENFAHHELVGQAWLLTITIVVTWFAGYIGWHKPHDEHGGGHGHHG